MDMIKIRSCLSQDVTIISNDFLDRFLPEANGEFIKIYLYLLRVAGSGSDSLSVCSIADRMNCTEKDVERALRYWEREGVLSITGGRDGILTDITFFQQTDKTTGTAASVEKLPVEPVSPDDSPNTTARYSDISSKRMTELGSREDIRELFFIAQQYLGKPLSRSEMQRICFFYDVLHFSPDLIDYLIEYCVNRNHKSFHYMEKVALNWKEQGISTVREARVAVGNYHREYYDILKALGIDNHHPIEAEIRIMKKWLEKYEFPMELITEACTRTVMGASKPTLNYADSILSKWYSRGVRTPEDVAELDREHAQAVSVKKTVPVAPKSSRNAFTDFEQRSYDYQSLESALIGGKG